MNKVYISPSPQQDNLGVTPYTTEENEMNGIGDKLITLLINDGRYETRRNDPGMDDIYSIANDSNNWGADIHIGLHSDAWNPDAKGTTVFAHSPGSNSDRLAKCIYAKIAPLSPGNDRGIIYKPSLIEVGNLVNATSILCEIAFHTNPQEAAFLAYNHELIAQKFYEGICDYYGYNYRLPKKAEPPQNSGDNEYVTRGELRAELEKFRQEIR